MVERAAEIGFLLLLVVGIPVMSWLTSLDPQLRTIPRSALYVSAALSEWLFAALGAAAVKVAGLNAAAIGLRAMSLRDLAIWTALPVAVAAAGLGVLLVLERWNWWPEESDLVRLLMPMTRAEKLWALAVVAPTAALVEEFLYRGYLFTMVQRFLHPAVWAWGLSSVAFGLAHYYQRPAGMVRAALLGALLAWPLVRTGNLYPSMTAHFLIDAAAFGWLGPRLLKTPQAENGG
ncbi:MAG TPA: CPBP family intramembrane glutamic endopeptidase [Terriglobia bacterium]|nr:CPBP family intramembrane glutamic endopeptidase [Terriglobia bacterium]